MDYLRYYDHVCLESLSKTTENLKIEVSLLRFEQNSPDSSQNSPDSSQNLYC